MIPRTFTQRGAPGYAGGSAMGAAFHVVLSFTIHYVSVNPRCLDREGSYTEGVPRLWNDTIDAHRRAVRDATIDTTAALVAKHGLRAVTMAQIAEETGIGRATLYKYFPDVESILLAWHERQIAAHLEQ